MKFQQLCIILLLCNTKINPIFMKNSKLNYNIVVIFIDDLRYLSGENVNLPNIQKIASKGIAFRNAFAQQALCAPSRNSILTGRRPDTLHLYDFYSYWRKTVGNFTTLPQLFKESGYYTYSVGKVFHPGVSSNFTDDFPYSWSQLPYHPPTERYKDAAVCHNRKTKKLKKNLVCPVKIDEQPEKTLPDLEILNEAIRILKSNNTNGKPLFLAVGFHKPHIPLKFPDEYLKNIPIETVLPPSYPNMPKNMPLVAWHPWLDVRSRDDIKKLNIIFPMGTMPRKWTLKIRQSYYAAAVYIDDLIGALVRHVNRTNTIIVLTSDHGWSLGENGLWAKYSNFDVALRVPLIFSVPGITPKFVTSPVELIDIFPTLVELTGLKKNIHKCKRGAKETLCFEGKSLVPLIRNKLRESQAHSAHIALSQYPRPSVKPQQNTDKPHLKDIKIMGYSLRTKRYRYTEWISFNNTSFMRNWNNIYGIELYDHFIDSNESNNLFMDHHYKQIKEQLSNLLRSRVGI